jgi:hypothetical protein
MPLPILDIIMRRAARQVTRRTSLLTLGGAAIAATTIAQPERASARKKKGKDCGKKERQRCANDIEACRLTVLLNCGQPGGCSDAARCCEACTAAGFATCALAQPVA